MIILVLFLILSISSPSFAINTPNVSADVLFLYRNSNFHKEDVDSSNVDQDRNGLNLREAELQFYSDVDPYSRLNVVLSVHPEYEASGTKVEEKWKIEPEEVFAESTALPSTTLKVGKFKAALGKHNLLHTHGFPFIDAPLANTNLLGKEGLNDNGVSAAVLLPLSWFSEITLQFIRGEGENEEFNSPSPSDGVPVTHWKNMFEPWEGLTLEIGASHASGSNTYRQTTTLTSGDLTLKWRPAAGGRYQSWTWSTEYLSRNQQQQGSPDEKGAGVSSWTRYQFAERWAALYRYDNLIIKDTFDSTNLPNDTWERSSLGLAFMPSEFSSFKIETGQRRGGKRSASDDDIERTVLLQANFLIGSHPSHSY